jgi:predicted DNA-binding ribbon-helix-helix protein
LERHQLKLRARKRAAVAKPNGSFACIAQPEEMHLQSRIAKRSIIIAGHKTSVSVEAQFWRELKDIAHNRQTSLSNIVTDIKMRGQGNLSSGIRLFVLDCLRAQTLGFAGNRTEAAEPVRENGQHPA